MSAGFGQELLEFLSKGHCGITKPFSDIVLPTKWSLKPVFETVAYPYGHNSN